MKKITLYLHRVFGFSKTEARGFLVLVFLCIILNLIPVLKPLFEGQNERVLSEKDEMEFQKFINEIEQSIQPIDAKKSEIKLFVWDPNKISQADMAKLGIRKKVSETLINYRNSGGQFYKKEDLLKLYGLDSVTYLRIAPYVFIDNSLVNRGTPDKNRANRSAILDINKADSLKWTNLRGIGSVLSSRIVKYRNLLGGYHSIDQLYEVYGLDSAVIKSIFPQLVISDSNSINKINLNFASYERLRDHPYINSISARKIVSKRTIDGSFENIEEIKPLIDGKDEWEKIEPYITLNNEIP
ncbi:MAG: helix-hairpin-helix domain-containing protein [Bacteroidota bacterium]